MYSPPQFQVASQQHFGASSTTTANAGDGGFSLGSSCLFPPPSFPGNLDCMRRFSYADLLSNHSEASLSDTETPSPANDYEEYVYVQQQHQPQPLESKQAFAGGFLDYYGIPGWSVTQQPMFGDILFDAPALTAAAPSETLLFQSQHTGFPSPAPSSTNASECSSPPVAVSEVARAPGVTGAVAASTTAPGSRSKAKSPRSRGRRVSSNPNTAAGQKMFTCQHDDCGKVFKRSEHLKRHIRSIHTLEKPFECPYQSCSKRFSRSDNLNQHIRIHRHANKEKPMAPTPSSASASQTSPSITAVSSTPCYMQDIL